MDWDTLKLCYVRSSMAWFTTQNVTKQWGDDWNDVPYEHNAGRPYKYHADSKYDQEKSEWEIFQVAWNGPYSDPADALNQLNSPWSVQAINRCAVPWLSYSNWLKDPNPTLHIYAGVTLREFIRLMRAAGGMVFMPVE